MAGAGGLDCGQVRIDKEYLWPTIGVSWLPRMPLLRPEDYHLRIRQRTRAGRFFRLTFLSFSGY